MSENQQPGVWNGWHWRFLTILVIAICLLELIAYEVVHYPMDTSVMLGALIVVYAVIPRLKERRVAHSIIGVVAVVIITTALEGYFEPNLLVGKIGFEDFLMGNGLALVVGILMSYLYLRLTDWSARKRGQTEAKRQVRTQGKGGTTSGDVDRTAPMQRRYERGRNKKRKKR